MLARAIPLLGLLILGACAQEQLAPELVAPSLALAPPEPASCRPYVNGNAEVSLFGLTHFPLGKARLSVSRGDLVIGNLRKSGEDGSCTLGPDAGRVRVVFSSLPSLMSGDALSFEFRRCVYPVCGGWAVGLRRLANGNLRGFYLPVCGSNNVVNITRNGQQVRSRQGSGQLHFPLPPGFLLHDVGTGDGITTMRGTDAGGNNWIVRGTPSAECASAPKVNEFKFTARYADGPKSAIWHQTLWE